MELNTAAINNSDLISEASDKFGSDRIVLAIDAKKKADNSGWTVLKSGGRVDTGMDAMEWAIKAVSLVQEKFF